MYLGIFSVNDTIYFRANTVNQNGSAADTTSGPTYAVYETNGTTALSTGSMTKVGSKTGFYQASFAASSSSYSVGQFFILIEATVDSQTPKAFIAFQLTADSHSLEETFEDVETIAESIPLIGGGSVSIDHNYTGTNAFRVASNGTPIANVNVRAFVRSDYDNGRKANRFVVGQTTTNTDGKWKSVIRLDPGKYKLEFTKKGAFKIQTANVTVI